MGDGHHRHNRRSRNLMATLKKAKNNDVRKAILEALQREFDRMSQSKLGKRVKQGAMGTANWGKRVAAKGEDYAKRPARYNHTRSSLGAYARKQAAEREKNRPAREAAKQARAQQRQDRRQQRATRGKQRQILGTSVAKKVRDIRAGRAAGTVTRTKAPARTPVAGNATRSSRATTGTTGRKPASPSRPAAGAREARAAKPAARTPALPSETIRPTRSSRGSRAPRSGGSASKTG